MSGQPGWIELAGQRVRVGDVRTSPYRYGRQLAAARATRSAVCLCRPQPLRLVTRCGLGGRHHLACWPHEGPTHDQRCPFFHLEPSLSGRSGYTSSAIEETTDGASIRFELPLVGRISGTESNAPAESAEPGRRRRAVGLLGTLHYVWETAGLTSWPGGAGVVSRTWSTVAARLGDALGSCLINGQRADEAVFVVPPYRPSTGEDEVARFDRFVDALRADQARPRHGLLIGEIKTIHATAHGVSYQLAHQTRARQLFASNAINTKLHDAYPAAMGAAGQNAGGRRIGVFYLQRSRGGYATVVDAAVMLTNAAYIPADSSYEVTMADALQAAGRAFIKPVTYDPGCGAVFPDFVLTDEPQAYVEVWGLPGRRDYEQRKAAKRAYYQRHARRLLEWTVTEPLPPLPPAPAPAAHQHAHARTHTAQ
ncbi:DUF1173 family protein [Mycolicibacterium mageritense]|uniref:DUF1173 family protein n=1 Tax=Mycolicibacterium mageritense TaxID=53462 RepID=UPI0023F12C38|nr:DUF1173 family protein [Mycolicibacterium mageritense]